MGKHRDRDGLEKDIDFHNQRLWKRKKYNQQRDKDQKKKNYKNYKKVINDEAEKSATQVDDKQRLFYENLFTKTPEEQNAPASRSSKKVKKPTKDKKPQDAPENAAAAVEKTTDVIAEKSSEPASKPVDTEDKTPKRAPKQGKNAVNGFKQKLESLKRQKSQEE